MQGQADLRSFSGGKGIITFVFNFLFPSREKFSLSVIRNSLLSNELVFCCFRRAEPCESEALNRKKHEYVSLC